jgi:hypothetical protein
LSLFSEYCEKMSSLITKPLKTQMQMERLALAPKRKTNANKNMMFFKSKKYPYQLGLIAILYGISTHSFSDARTVTHAGSAGLDTQFFTSGAVGTNSNCNVCHDGITALDWSDYSVISPYLVSTFLTRLNADPVIQPVVFMPQGGNTNVDTTMLESWFSQNKYQYRSPYIATGSNGSNLRVGTNNYSKSVSFTVNENGADSTFTAYYRKGADAWSDVSSSNPAGTGGSGSADSDGTSNASLTNLECGNTYSYYLYGNNAAAGTTGATNTFSITCNTGATLSGSPTNATEDSLSTFTPTITSGVGTDTLSYSFSVAPTGLAPKPTINSSTGEVSWTPVEGQTSSSFNIQVSDSAADTSITDTLAVTWNVDPFIDNDPVIDTIQGDLSSATENSLFEHTIISSDLDVLGDSWTFSLVAQDDPAMSIVTNGNEGDFSWTPAEGDAITGTFNFTVRITDSDSRFDEATFTITVGADNSAPSISGTPISTGSTTEDIPYSMDLNATDPDLPDTESWSIESPASPPDDMAIDSSGVLTWTPGEGINRTENVTIRVTDGGSLWDETSFNINVTAVNDAPVFLTPIPDDSVEEHSAFAYTLDVNDSDPLDKIPDLSSNLTFQITNVSPTPDSTPPAIDASGEITWTPGNNDARTVSAIALSQNYTISVSVADGGEDLQGPATQDFTLTVTLQDADSDTVPDYEDNCVNTSNTDQANNDLDAQGDLCDPDDDNDGVSDIAENANPPMDDFLDSDATDDVDLDGLTNLAEFNTCTSTDINSLDTCLNISTDSVAPIITHNGDFDITAKGYTTFVDFKATASDGNDGAVEVTADTNSHDLRPGDHVITWTAQDQIPNVTNVEQYITIHPIVTLGSSQVLAENASGEIVIQINGDVPAADFPLQIAYTLSGTSSASDYLIDLPSPITINDASEIIDGKFTLYIDALSGDATESPESLTITLDSVSGGPVLGDTASHEILIVDGQVAPTASLVATQNTIDTNFIFGDQGIVTVNANAVDGNLDSLSYDWSNSDLALSGIPTVGSFNFDPSTLVIAPEDLPRIFKVAVSISDGKATINKQILLSYQGDTLVLASIDTDGDGVNDDIEGLADSDGDGIPNYLDAYENPPNLLFTGNPVSNNTPPEFIQVESGNTISLGEYSLANNTNQPKLNMTTLNNLGASSSDTGFVHFGAIYEFVITGLTEVKPSARVVIPLENSIPSGAIYRKFDGTQWFTFVESANDSISSANSNENGCPQPGSESYETGLLSFRDCIQLQLSDGGANDSDGEANGTIVDPGGLALSDDADIFEPEQTIDESSLFDSNGPDSSGFISLWFSLLLGLFAQIQLKQKRQRKTK